jgi:hypothetical protein
MSGTQLSRPKWPPRERLLFWPGHVPLVPPASEVTAGIWRASVKRGLRIRFQAIGKRNDRPTNLSAGGAVVHESVNRNRGWWLPSGAALHQSSETWLPSCLSNVGSMSSRSSP